MTETLARVKFFPIEVQRYIAPYLCGVYKYSYWYKVTPGEEEYVIAAIKLAATGTSGGLENGDMYVTIGNAPLEYAFMYRPFDCCLIRFMRISPI